MQNIIIDLNQWKTNEQKHEKNIKNGAKKSQMSWNPKNAKNSSILEIFCFAFIFNYLSFLISESLFRHASRILGLCKVFVTFSSLFGRTCSKT